MQGREAEGLLLERRLSSIQGEPKCEGRDWQGTRAERTVNMPCIFVTLDVSRLSGWLNTAAPCRVDSEAWEEGRTHAGPRVAGERVGQQRRKPCAGRTQRTVEAAGRARAERTSNMCPMVVTLDVSRLSGWLNAAMPCRVEREA